MQKNPIDQRSKTLHYGLIAIIFALGQAIAFIRGQNIGYGIGVGFASFLGYALTLGNLKPTFPENQKRFVYAALVAGLLLVAASGMRV